jgi:membrane-associated phospholipid phosphatase
MKMTRQLWSVVLLVQLSSRVAGAQQAGNREAADSAADSARRPAVAIRAWHVGVALVGTAALTLLDQPIHHATQQRNDSKDDVASVVKHFGQPEVYATVGLGTIAVGLIAGNDRISMAGVRISSAVLLAGGAVGAIKIAVGRSRPYQTDHPWQFKPFNIRDASFPSGHSAVAFALATSISDEVHRTWATVPLYVVASGTGLSRLNDDKHWFSDVVAGTILGIASAKFANGRWRILGISAPHFLLGPRSAGLELTSTLPAIR